MYYSAPNDVMSQWKKLTESFQKEWKKIHNEHPSGTSADEAEKYGTDPKYKFYFQLTFLKPFKKQRKYVVT